MTVRPIGPLALLAIIVVVLFAGCGLGTPTPAPAALHVENRLADPVVVDVSERGGSSSTTFVLTSCGGTLDIAPGVNGVATRDWLVILLRDPSGNLRARLDAVGGDPSMVAGSIDGLLIIWSTGEIDVSQHPRWLTVEPAGVLVSDSAPGLRAPATCLPWAFPPEG